MKLGDIIWVHGTMFLLYLREGRLEIGGEPVGPTNVGKGVLIGNVFDNDRVLQGASRVCGEVRDYLSDPKEWKNEYI